MRTFLLVAGACVLLPARSTEACPCGPVGPACAEYWTASAIFRGRVESIQSSPATAEEPHGGKLVTFSVLDPLKSVAPNTRVEVYTPANRRACGYPFLDGREYVVYASKRHGRLTTGTCSRTRPAERAQDDAAYIKEMLAGKTLGRISGRVVLRSRDLARARQIETPMAGVPVLLRRGEFSISTRTNHTGFFAVAGLAPGAYAASLEVPDRRFVIEAPPAVELADVRGCVELNAVVQPQGRIRGRVIDSLGRPLRGLTLELTARDARGRIPDNAQRMRTVTRGDGTYEFMPVPPGQFVVGINTESHRPELDEQAFHPGTLEVQKASAIRLAAGEEVGMEDFVMPASIALRVVTGMVVDTAGAPAEGARVYLSGPGDRGVIYGEAVTTDFMGRFTITALDGRQYQIFAERSRPGAARGRVDISRKMPLEFSPATSFVKLIVTRR